MQAAVLTKASLLEYEGKIVGKRVNILGEDGVWRAYDCELNALPFSRRETVIKRNLPVLSLLEVDGLLTTEEERVNGVVAEEVTADQGMREYLEFSRLRSGAFLGSAHTQWCRTIPKDPLLLQVDGVGVVLHEFFVAKDEKESKASKEVYAAQTDVSVTVFFADGSAFEGWRAALSGVAGADRVLGGLVPPNAGTGLQRASVRAPLSMVVSVCRAGGFPLTLPADGFAYVFEEKGVALGEYRLTISGERDSWEAHQEELLLPERRIAVEKRISYLALLRDLGVLAITHVPNEISG